MRHLLLAIPALYVAADLCQAQSQVVVPTLFANTEGNDLGTYPWGRPTCHTQQIWAGTALASTTALISAMAYRPDNDNSTGGSLVNYGSVTVDVSTTSLNPASMTTTFSSNITGTPTNV